MCALFEDSTRCGAGVDGRVAGVGAVAGQQQLAGAVLDQRAVAAGAGGERTDDDLAGQLRCGGLRGGGAGFDGIRAGRARGLYGPHGGGAGDVGG